MNTMLKILGLFLIITGLSTILMDFSVEFGQVNYWDVRGVFFLFFITLFPRLTLLFSSVVSGGFLWWLAWLFAPRFLVAYLATIAYWNTNPILVILSWVIALGGETSEKTVVINRSSPFKFKRTIIINKGSAPQTSQPNFGTKYNVADSDTIEADFTVKEEKDI